MPRNTSGTSSRYLASVSTLALFGAVAIAAKPALARSPQCMAAAAQAAAPAGVMIGSIIDASPALPAGFTGAMDVPAANGVAEYCLITGTVVTNFSTGKTANFATILPAAIAPAVACRAPGAEGWPIAPLRRAR